MAIMLRWSFRRSGKQVKNNMEYNISQIVTDQFSMKYLSFGNGRKKLVILPGLSVQSVTGFAPSIINQYKCFTDDFTVYVFDRRSDPPDNYDIFHMAEDTVNAFTRLELSGIYLFGVSQGGMIALTIAATYPEMISRLSVSSTVMRMDEKRFDVIRKWIELAEKKNSTGLYLSIAKHIYPIDFFEQSKDAFAEIAKIVTDDELANFVKLANGIKGFDLTDKIAQIKCPVQLSYDEDDSVFVDDPASELKKQLGSLAGFESKSFNGYGHALYDTAPGFAEWLFGFFEEEKVGIC